MSEQTIAQKKFKEYAAKKRELLLKMVDPAKAAVNQMKDAGMIRGSDPLAQILFELDAADEEIKNIFSNDPLAFLEIVDMVFPKE